jgi:muramidase (phage lysozyme)
MADLFTAEEIEREGQRLAKALKNNWISHEEYSRGMKDLATGVKNYTATLQASRLSLKKAAGDLVGSMKDSAQGAAQYSDALSAGAEHISNALSKTGMGRVVGTLIKGATMYVNAVAKQSDALFKSYNDISRSGATAAGGITELYTNMQKFGYGVAELGNLASLVQENANNLALMGGTVFEGTKTFADMSKTIRDSDIGFRFEKMGINVDNMNKGIAGYLRIQTITGQQELQTQEQLQRGAEAYIMQQDRLTKLTGASADRQQQITEQALSEERFAASQRQLMRRAQEENNDALKQEAIKRRDFNVYLTENVGPETARAFRDISSGYLTSPESRKFLRTFPEAAALIRQGANMDEVQAAMKRGAQTTARATEELGKMGKSAELVIAQNELNKMLGIQDLADAEKQANKQQKIDDAATGTMTGLARTQRRTRDALQDLIQVGIRPVTGMMEGLANVMGTIPGVAAGSAAKISGGAGGIGGDTAGGGVIGFFKKALGIGKAPAGVASSGKLLDLIGQAESGGNYNALVGGKRGANTAKEADLTNMTIAEVQKYQKNMIAQGHLSTAVGKYQMIADTLKDQVAKSGLDPTKTKFDQKTQDILAQQLVNQAGYGKQDTATVMKNLAGTWASLPRDMSGRGQYDGFNSNRASVDPKALANAIRQPEPKALVNAIRQPEPKVSDNAIRQPGYQSGGIASGPTSGYQAMLHGTEAVIPLPDGKTIPVEMPGFTATLADQTGLMAQQLGKLDELVRVMQSQVNVSNKILQRSQ